jgi:probable HAF family extracellular repeat protein
VAIGINNTGRVVGYASTTDLAVTRATLWSGSTTTDLGTLGGASSYAYGINDAGQVVGFAHPAGDVEIHAALWNGGNATDLGTLGGATSAALGINNAGQVVGFSITADGTKSHAMLWNGSTATDLNTFLDASAVSAGWYLQGATDINDNGWIVGSVSNTFTGVNHAFLLSVSAVPEPETYSMLLAGLGLMAFMSRRRKQA